MKLSKWYDCPAWPGEVNSGERRTETAGYIPIERRIKNIMAAGEKLLQATIESYDYMDEIPEEPEVNVATQKGLDITDLEGMARSMAQRKNAELQQKKQEVKSAKDTAGMDRLSDGSSTGSTSGAASDKVLKE